MKSTSVNKMWRNYDVTGWLTGSVAVISHSLSQHVARSSQLSRTHSHITVAIVNDALGTLARTVFVVRGKHTVVGRRRTDDRAKPDRHIGARTQPPIPPGRRPARSSIAGVHFVRTQHPVCARLQPDHPGRLSPYPRRDRGLNPPLNQSINQPLFQAHGP